MKKQIRRLVRWILLLAILFFSRGWLYRQVVAYQSVGTRMEYPPVSLHLTRILNKKWEQISLKSPGQSLEMDQIVDATQQLTAETLTYKWENCPSDPNETVLKGGANCVGYAAFCAMACTDFFYKAGLSQTWKARPVVGKLAVLGVDIHPYFHSSFFRDHDFVMVENIQTGERMALDPTVFDMAGVKRIRLLGF